MSRSFRLSIAGCLAVAVMAVGGPAAATCNNLLCICTATTLGVGFSTYDPTSSTDNTSTGSVTVSCILTILSAGSYSISLSPGQSGSYASRSMTYAGSTLSYNLYTAAGSPAPVWGDGTGGSQTVTGSFSASLINSQTFYVYGRAPAKQNVAAGPYADTVLVTVTY